MSNKTSHTKCSSKKNMFQRNNSPSPTLPNLDSSFQSSVFFSTFARENVPPTSKPTTKPHTEISIDPFRGSHWASQTHSHPSAEHLHLAAIFFLLEICEKTMGESKILGGVEIKLRKLDMVSKHTHEICEFHDPWTQPCVTLIFFSSLKIFGTCCSQAS